MKINFLLCLVCLTSFSLAQTKDNRIIEKILLFQDELNQQFRDTAESPLPDGETDKFTGHDFFPINLKYRVEAQLIKTPESKVFEMPTTTTRKPLYKQYAIAIFIIDSVEYRLSLFQSQNLMEKEEYKDYLFLPFKDHTNGIESYGGGRYIDLKIPGGDIIIIDFNQSYNPYCAYSSRYSCPIPPDENSLETRIEAGIRYHGY